MDGSTVSLSIALNVNCPDETISPRIDCSDLSKWPSVSFCQGHVFDEYNVSNFCIAVVFLPFAAGLQ